MKTTIKLLMKLDNINFRSLIASILTNTKNKIKKIIPIDMYAK